MTSLRRLRGTELDRRLRAEARAARRAERSRWERIRHIAGWPLCIAGAVLFLASYVASTAGRVILPFDQHHLIGQIGGGLLAVTGYVWATR